MGFVSSPASRLQLLSIYYNWHDWTTERIVAEKMEEFPVDLTVELRYSKI